MLFEHGGGVLPGLSGLGQGVDDGGYFGAAALLQDGERAVLFELNGVRREVTVVDHSAADQVKKVPLADPENKLEIGAQIPGAVSKIFVKRGDTVKAGEVLAVIEAMKMETSVVARMAGIVDEVFIKEGTSVKAGELLMTVV